MSINCQSIGKSYQRRKVLHELTNVFEKGQCHCIIGDNGTGKTTLLKIIAGLIQPDSGEVQVTGTCTYAGSNPYMMRGTVLDNLTYPMTLRRQGKRIEDKPLRELMARLGLQGLEHNEAHSLSSGEKQKVALGRAMVWHPDILLLDEPTANIDPASKPCIEALLQEYVSLHGHTLLVVSHEKEQAIRLAGTTWHLTESGLIQCC